MGTVAITLAIVAAVLIFADPKPNGPWYLMIVALVVAVVKLLWVLGSLRNG